MKIRTITVFADVGPPLNQGLIAMLGDFTQTARQAYEAMGYEVQTTRLSVSLFPLWRHFERPKDPIEFAIRLEEACQQIGLNYVSLGPVEREFIERLPELLESTQSVFAVSHVTDRATLTIDGDAINRTARVIQRNSTISQDGIANLRFAALANVGPGSPFFPAAYPADGAPAFAIGTQAADLAIAACAEARDAESARWRLMVAIEKQARRIQSVARKLIAKHDIRFMGTDFSLAPSVRPEESIGAALEQLSGAPLGMPGSLAAATALVDAIDRAQFTRCGFSGLMVPVLEDAILARRVAEGRIGLADLMQWSAVCGTGLDTVPLPGDASETAIASILFDVAALALRLGKPLTARLMPIPGKAAGDMTSFDFPYLTDSRVIALEPQEESSLISRAAGLRISPRVG